MNAPPASSELRARLRRIEQRWESGARDEALSEFLATETDGLTADDYVRLGRTAVVLGRRDLARQLGRRAQALEPKHREAFDLIGTPYLVDGVEHAVPLIASSPKGWEGLGKGTVILGVLATAALVVVVPFAPPDPGAKDPFASFLPKPSALSFATVALYFVAVVASFSWMIFDAIDRRSKLVWLLWVPIFGLVGLPWVPPLAYRYFTRRLALGRAADVRRT